MPGFSATVDGGCTSSTRGSWGGGGRNAFAGTRGPSEHTNASRDRGPPAPRPDAHRVAAHAGSTRLAALEPARRRGEPAEQRSGRTERRVGDDLERTARQAQVGGVGAHDGHASVGEPLAQDGDPLLVQLDGDDVRAGAQQLGR